MSIGIRRATMEDAVTVASLYVELKHHHRRLAPSAERYQVDDSAWEQVAIESLRDPETTIFVAEVDERVVGFVKLELVPKPWGTSCEIATLIIENEMRGRGIGLALLRRSEDFARQVRAQAMRVDVLHTNEPGRAFYEREGYELFAVRYGKPVRPG